MRDRTDRRKSERHCFRLILCLLLPLILLLYVLSTDKRHEVAERQSAENGIAKRPAAAAAAPPDGNTKHPAADDTDAGITLVMVGDILLHTPVAESGQRPDGSYCFDELFAHVDDVIAEADLALVNQEVIIGGSELGVSGYPCFNAPYELGDALAAAGFDVILHATNHALDKGEAGVRNCLSYWEAHPDITVLGLGAGNRICVCGQDGIRIAILNYTYGTNGIPMPASMPDAVSLLEEETVLSDLELAEELADFTVVCPHWGTEYQLVPSGEQEYWTALFLENGADLCIGTHPHVIQPVEWKSDDEGHAMLVYYSLGNFVNWTSSSGDGIANRMVGGMATVTIGRDEENGEVRITDYGIEPLVCHLSPGTDGVTTWFLSDYTEELARENAITAQDPAFSREYCVSLCNEVWGSRFHFE